MGSGNSNAKKATADVKVVDKTPQILDRRLTLDEQVSIINPQNLRKQTSSISQNENDLGNGSFMATQNYITLESIPSPNQKTYEDKLFQILGEENQFSVLQKLKMWVSCKKGLKSTPNQDDFVVVIDGDDYAISVLDGHGEFGHHVSHYVHKELPNLLYSHPEWHENPEKAIKESILSCHSNLTKLSYQKNSEFDCNMSGCTCSLVYKKGSVLYVGHLGDSRAIIGRRVDGEVTAVKLTTDHKPELEKEKERIESAGGEIRKLPGGPNRIYLKGRQYPGISMTRAIGNLVSQSVGIVSVPDTMTYNLEEGDEFIVLATDGVWEFISNQEVIRIVTSSSDPKEAASRISALAWTKWISAEETLVDDITIIIAYL